jgi:hypothetical protein
MATSRNVEANAMVCARFRHDFGPRNVFSLRPTGPDEKDQRRMLAHGLRAQPLFGDDVSWTKLASMAAQGATIRSTRITEEFDFEAFNASQNDNSINLFALDASDRLRVFGSTPGFTPEDGWKIVSLSPEKEKEKEKEKEAKKEDTAEAEGDEK